MHPDLVCPPTRGVVPPGLAPSPAAARPVRGRALRILVTAALCVGGALGPATDTTTAAEDAPRREFSMGFTPFPWDISEEAVRATEEFLSRGTDVICHHFDNGVPWTEALEDRPFHPNLQADWEKRRQLSARKKVYLALTPLDSDRKDLALYRGADENQPLPEAFRGKALDDPAVKEAYLNYVLRAVDWFRPDHLAIGIEVNELILNAPLKWPRLLALYDETRAAVKARQPSLPVCATVTLHALTDPSRANVNQQQAKIRSFLDRCDFAGISYYPFLAGNMARPEDPLDWLKTFTTKPLAIAETGFPAETIRLQTIPLTLTSSPALQASYVQKLLLRAERDRYIFVIWFLHRDYDALWERIKASVPEFFIVWKDCGLLDETGQERPAFEVWKRYLERSSLRAGDCNQDGRLDISDALCVFGHLFLGTPSELACGDGTAGDAANRAILDNDSDSTIDIADGILLLKFLFGQGRPSFPGPECVPMSGCPAAPCG